MIDLHSHSFFSDGALVPAEHVRRVETLGYTAIAITDHADSSNISILIPALLRAAKDMNPVNRTQLIVGVELTHVPPPLIAPLAAQSRELGAQLVVVHGESPVEPVAPGTNRAALEADIDLLAHPGFITEEEAQLAAKNNIFLELSGRRGHSLTNGHVAKMAERTGAQLAINADAHAPGDFLTPEMAERVGLGAGLSRERYLQIRHDMAVFVHQLKPLT
ncbi:histidinol phosphate phosphatase domain-containing protein [Desulfobulbus oligotrophicus]|jgi:histidinol phosphatase-like PHP family hydrolase|uniref:Histidinol phosphate phosphatase domain-containing protein n=1 Tax=Desulfobulbus oligotrophicus TaxID=1909699 RepID=A0A7T5VEE4_9BACT|nr:histidinol phosphate phosphatase domain-containing protein [Desulfobulbus oligotrophicus]MDY0390246.1 histidinol phosphate phosphatase domain-containing protein [Desulfobulbus oligotrophicus]QQG66256.1 histidinol phosphate phosphatase domain-containing protein [Desulfobulbus oligotrophicus]